MIYSFGRWLTYLSGVIDGEGPIGRCGGVLYRVWLHRSMVLRMNSSSFTRLMMVASGMPAMAKLSMRFLRHHRGLFEKMKRQLW
jgi:hypothetical protein